MLVPEIVRFRPACRSPAPRLAAPVYARVRSRPAPFSGFWVASAARCWLSVVGVRERSPADQIVPLFVTARAEMVALPLASVEPMMTAFLPEFSTELLARLRVRVAWIALVLVVSVEDTLTEPPVIVPSLINVLPAAPAAPDSAIDKPVL